jgi:glycine cleavage system H protein
MTTTSYPENLRYTKDHEWARTESDGTITVGITTHAVDQLGDITLVTLPAAGTQVAPITGEIVDVNAGLVDAPESVNTDPYGAGWMVRIRPGAPAELDGLLTSEAYTRLVADGG